MVKPRHPCRVAGCTEPQVRAFEELAKGRGTCATLRTLGVLEGKGLLEKDPAGYYRVPTWAVAEWVRWCEFRALMTYAGVE